MPLHETLKTSWIDNPHEKIRLKAFHAEIVNDTEKLNKEVAQYKSIPAVAVVPPNR